MASVSDPFFALEGGSFSLNTPPPTVTSQGGGSRVSVRQGKVRFFKNSKAIQAGANYESLLKCHAPQHPVAGAVGLHVTFVFPYRKGEPKKNRNQGWIWKTTKPDTDNMVKLLKDCMTRTGFWLDDAQVCLESVQKVFGEDPQILVTWNELHSDFVQHPRNEGVAN